MLLTMTGQEHHGHGQMGREQHGQMPTLQQLQVPQQPTYLNGHGNGGLGQPLDEQNLSLSHDDGSADADDEYADTLANNIYGPNGNGSFGGLAQQFANNNGASPSQFSTPSQASFGTRQPSSQQNPQRLHQNNRQLQRPLGGKHYPGTVGGSHLRAPAPPIRTATIPMRSQDTNATEDHANNAVTPINNSANQQFPRTVKECHALLRKHIKDKANLVTEVAGLQTNVEQLRAKLKSARSSKACTKQNVKTCKTIKDVYRIHMFRRAKWIRNKDDMGFLAETAYDFVYSEQDRDEKGDDYRSTWVNTYTDHMKTVVNARRSYIQSQCKLAVFRYYKQHKKMPTLDGLIKCVTRDIDPEDTTDYELFHWFWDDLMGKWPSARCFFCK